jgi:DNA-binding CsgD family transcriptional regulator
MSRVGAAVVGRRAEVERVERFLGDVHDGPRALAVTGPAGIGKSTVWQAGVDLAVASGRRLLAARPTGAEASLSFAALGDLLRPIDNAIMRSLPEPQRRALGVALLRETARAPIDARAVATATHSILKLLAAEGPTVLAVDDAQWLDDASADALGFALRRLVDEPIGVLTGVRADSLRPQTFETVLEPAGRDELALGPLSTAAVHDVILGRIGWTPTRPTLVRIVQASAGNVYYALEIARELAERDAGDALPVPPSLQSLVRARTERLPAETRTALVHAAALSVPTTAVVSEEALLAAEDADLVTVAADGRISFVHPLVASAIYDSTSHTRRRRVHRELAALVRDKEERARHLALAASAPDEEVAAELDSAAAHAAARGASAAAAELGRLALALTVEPSGERRLRRSLALARHLLGAGDTPGARSVLEACDPAWAEGDLRAELLRDLANLLWYEGDHGAGYRLACEALEHARDPELAARTHCEAAWLLQDYDLERAIAHEDAAVALLDPERAPGRYSWALLHGAYLRLLDGQGSDTDAYARGVALQRGVEWADNSPVSGMWPILHDDFARARAIYEEGLVWSRAEGDEPSVQGTLVRLTEIACWTGELAEADRHAAEGIALADRVGSTTYLDSALFARGLVDAHLGRVDAARATADRIFELTSDRLRRQTALGHWVLGFVSLSLGDAAAADLSYTRAAEAVALYGQREPARFRFQPDHLEAVVEVGDLDRARDLLRALEERGVAFPRPWLLATGARCRALVLAAEGDLAGALAAATEALDHHERLAMPFERARTLIVTGVILRRLKRKRRAREVLEEAASEFDRLGTPLWLDRARSELGRVAVRRATDGLTASELQIAKLAADGLSNPEIAARAFVSRKTVEANLARAYRKLGIASRAQLARALDAIS